MASKTINLNLLMIIIIIIASSNLFIIPTHQFSSRQLSRKDMNPLKTTFLKFYFYDKPSPPNATAVTIAMGPNTNTSRTFFGGLVMIDDALLAAPRVDAKIIGRAQGMYGGADMTNISLLMVLNYVFTAGKYNGSTLSVLGRNSATQDPKEMPIIGGTGQFRFAQGFALAHIAWFKPNGDAMVQYNVTVYHPNLNI